MISDVQLGLPSHTALHVYLAFEKSTENSTIFIQRIYEFIDKIITQRINMSADNECAIDNDNGIVYQQYFSIYIRKNATHSVGFQSYWQSNDTATQVKRQIQQTYEQLFSVR